MRTRNIFDSPEGQAFLKEIRLIFEKTNYPPEHQILDETDLCNMLKISKRHSADLRREGKIKYAKDGGKIYYLLSWVLEYLDKYRINPPSSKLIN